MTESDILKSIGENLSERKTTAALSNYEVLCSNIKHVNDILQYCAFTLGGITSTAQNALSEVGNISSAFQEKEPLAPFRSIIPRVLANGSSILQKFIHKTEPDDRSGITVATVTRLSRGFEEYSDLATAARQAVDSIISDSYQLLKLDAREINYHVLVSLNSFDKYATPSIRHTLFNKAVSTALGEFRKLPYKQWKDSPITRCEHSTFAKKVDFICSQLAPTPPDADLAEGMKDLFKFSSEFTHIGYVSTFFSSSVTSEVIFGDDHGPYLPSTENFSELKYELLATITKMIAQVYIPCIKNALATILLPASATSMTNSLDSLSAETMSRLKTRNAQYYFFVKKGLVGSGKIISLPCRCGTERQWATPHNKVDLYCKGCGSTFNLLEVDGDGGFIITSSGPAKIIGSDVPDFHDLPPEEQLLMLKQVEEMTRKNMKC